MATNKYGSVDELELRRRIAVALGIDPTIASEALIMQAIAEMQRYSVRMGEVLAATKLNLERCEARCKELREELTGF
jgi:hypothetical protein